MTRRRLHCRRLTLNDLPPLDRTIELMMIQAARGVKRPGQVLPPWSWLDREVS